MQALAGSAGKAEDGAELACGEKRGGMLEKLLCVTCSRAAPSREQEGWFMLGHCLAVLGKDPWKAAVLLGREPAWSLGCASPLLQSSLLGGCHIACKYVGRAVLCVFWW